MLIIFFHKVLLVVMSLCFAVVVVIKVIKALVVVSWVNAYVIMPYNEIVENKL